MVAQTSNSSSPPYPHPAAVQNIKSEIQNFCALCGLPASRQINDTFNGESLTFCCYGCRHIYEVVAPDLARGIDVRQAMGQAISKA